MQELVRFDNVYRTYGMGDTIVHALAGVTFTIRQGEYVAIMGPSGSGKSTILNLLGCLDRPTNGRYFIGGENISSFSDDRLSDVRGQRIGFIFQSFNLIPRMSVLANIEVPLFYQGIPRGLRRARSMELAQLVGLGDRIEHKPSELSGGQQQRVAMARALANDPLLLLADEPTGNLDSHTTEGILQLFDALSDRGSTIIMVTHEDHVAARTHRTIQLKDGRIDSDVTNGAAKGGEQ